LNFFLLILLVVIFFLDLGRDADFFLPFFLSFFLSLFSSVQFNSHYFVVSGFFFPAKKI